MNQTVTPYLFSKTIGILFSFFFLFSLLPGFINIKYVSQTGSLNGQTGCPGCEMQLDEDLTLDTIYLDPIPDGTKNLYYDNDVSFRLPMTTTPVAVTDPSVLPGLIIDEISILAVNNLPEGINWESNKESFILSEGTDGCIKLCGIPLKADSFDIEVILNARFGAFNRQTTVNLSMYIAPSVSINDGFNMMDFEGCGQVLVSFENNVPSEGDEGYSYNWDFGNGKTSNDENPTNQLYSEPGEYEVNYEALIDTIGFILTEIRIEDVPCGDFLGRPDIFININDPSGQSIYQTQDRRNENPPISFKPNIRIGPGQYTLEVKDEDGGLEGGDDICTIMKFTQNINGKVTGIDWELFFNVIHNVDTISTKDTIRVYPIPDKPFVSIAGETTFCDGDSMVLSSSYGVSNLWYKDGIAIAMANDSSYIVTEGGNYQVAYTTEQGCTSFSDVIGIQVNPLPEAPIVDYIGETTLCEGDTLTLNSSYADNNVWYLNNEVIDGAIANTFDVSNTGEYQVAFTNENGCMQFSEIIAVDVLPLPVVPEIALNGEVSFCEGETVTLTSSYNESNIWYKDGEVIDMAIDSSFIAMQSGAYTVAYTNENGCVSFSESVSIEVLALPAEPVIDLRGETEICMGETVTLTSSYIGNNAWYKDGVVIEEEVFDSYDALSTGEYQVAYTAENGCVAFSEAVMIMVKDLPAEPVFINVNNELMFNEEVVLPQDYSLQWYLNDSPLADSADSSLCSTESGLYRLVVIDNVTKCANSYELEVMNDPAFDCLNPTSVAELDAAAIDWKLFPNPFSERVQISFNLKEQKEVQWTVYDMLGRNIYESGIQKLEGQQQLEIDGTDWASGFYLIQLRLGDKRLTRRMVKGK